MSDNLLREKYLQERASGNTDSYNDWLTHQSIQKISVLGPLDEIINRIEKLWKGSGALLSFVVVNTLSTNSTLFIGAKGFGKTPMIKTIIENAIPKKYSPIELNQPTRNELLDKGVGSDKPEPIKDKHWIFVVPDFTTLLTYHIDQLFSVTASLIWDNNFTHTLCHQTIVCFLMDLLNPLDEI